MTYLATFKPDSQSYVTEVAGMEKPEGYNFVDGINGILYQQAMVKYQEHCQSLRQYPCPTLPVELDGKEIECEIKYEVLNPVGHWIAADKTTYDRYEDENTLRATALPVLPAEEGDEREVELSCMVCGKIFKGTEPKMCCSGRDCGCMGLPVDPVVCSEECYNNLPMNKILKEQSAALPTAAAISDGKKEELMQQIGKKYFPCTCNKEVEGRRKHFSDCPQDTCWWEALDELYKSIAGATWQSSQPSGEAVGLWLEQVIRKTGSETDVSKAAKVLHDYLTNK